MQNRTGQFIKVALFLGIASVAMVFLAAVSHIVKLVIISALLAYVMDPLANFLESRGMSRASATVAIFCGIFALAGVSYSVFLPSLSAQISSLQSGLHPEKAGVIVSGLEDFLVSHLSFLGVTELHLVSRLENSMASLGDWIVSHFLDAASVITSMILIPFIVFFLMKDGREFKRSFVRLMPNRYFEFTLYLLHKLNNQVGNYLRGQLIDATVVGIFSTFAMWLIGLKYFLMIGIFAGLANLVPYFGPITGAVLAVIVSVLQTGNFEQAFYVIVAFAIIKLIDDAIVQPVVVAKSVHMHPLTVLLSVLVGGKLFGILGMLLAVPVTGFLKVTAVESMRNFLRYREG